MVEVSNDVIEKIIKIVKDGGGEVYEQDGYINFCGVRNNVTDNTFNDTLYVYWKDSSSGEFKCVKTTGFTTKPGAAVVLGRKARNTSGGAAILKEGWQKDIWHHGKHKGKYDALRSSSGITNPTVITRDNSQYDQAGNKYELRIFNDKTYSGHFGINFHKSGDPQGNAVNDWSAGCQVFKVKKEFDEVMSMANFATQKGQKTFSYFLTNKNVFDGNGVVDNNTSTSYDFSQSQFAGGQPSTSSSGVYGGCGNVSQLGNYTNSPDAQIIHQQNQSREDVLNTLVNGSYTPNDVKKCAELITSEKKKNKKTKSES